MDRRWWIWEHWCLSSSIAIVCWRWIIHACATGIAHGRFGFIICVWIWFELFGPGTLNPVTTCWWFVWVIIRETWSWLSIGSRKAWTTGICTVTAISWLSIVSVSWSRRVCGSGICICVCRETWCITIHITWWETTIVIWKARSTIIVWKAWTTVLISIALKTIVISTVCISKTVHTIRISIVSKVSTIVVTTVEIVTTATATIAVSWITIVAMWIRLCQFK